MLFYKILGRGSLLLSLIVSSGCYYANGVDYDPLKAHHGDNGFISTKESSFFGHAMMRWREDPAPPRDPLAIAKIEMPADLELINSPAEQPRVTWIGHATSLVQYKDINYLTDPHLTQYPFYFEMFIDPRYTQPALTFEEMPDIDFIVISHNHYDHLDHRTVDLFGNSVMWYVPLGMKNWFLDRGIAADRVIEMDWWESQTFSEAVEITFTPNEHWSKRTPWDTNQTLWGSWAVNIAGFKSWFAGDTGYHESYFREIGEKLGPFRLAMIPIGAYAPRYFMAPAHVDPAEAIDIHRDIQSQKSIPVHWGTFQLTIEPALEPPALLREEMALRKLPMESFEPIKIGQTLILD
ncbi:MAG: N-acyl-phosphatidylethanolamine-hydrolyzing phospholipase D [Gammaproteobacteria bacterium]|jgi:N-acyl-phosphatidylethanolamine-hydrolysing phospholipase D